MKKTIETKLGNLIMAKDAISELSSKDIKVSEMFRLHSNLNIIQEQYDNFETSISKKENISQNEIEELLNLDVTLELEQFNPEIFDSMSTATYNLTKELFFQC